VQAVGVVLMTDRLHVSLLVDDAQGVAPIVSQAPDPLAVQGWPAPEPSDPAARPRIVA
jgi:hypothetical protein